MRPASQKAANTPNLLARVANLLSRPFSGITQPVSHMYAWLEGVLLQVSILVEPSTPHR